jgi:hypothetical protein
MGVRSQLRPAAQGRLRTARAITRELLNHDLESPELPQVIDSRVLSTFAKRTAVLTLNRFGCRASRLSFRMIRTTRLWFTGIPRRRSSVVIRRPVTPAMLQSNLLDYRSHFRLFLRRMPFLQRAVETSATDRNQLAQALDTQAALQKHYFSDLLVDPSSPVSPLFWRRASTFCEAPLKKSTSRVFSATSRCASHPVQHR